jgi:hypothetical protein
MKNRMVLRWNGWLLLLVAVWPAYADDVDHQLTEARTVFLRGVDGDKHAVREATHRFRALSQEHPREPIFVAYLGACMSLQGRDAENNLEKKQLTDEGVREIDQALKMLSEGADQGSPRYLDTLLVATNTFIHIPAFFNRYDEGKRLLQKILADPAFEGMAPGFKAAAYMAAALVAHGEGDDGAYRRYLNLTVSADPDGRDGRSASELLGNAKSSE